MIPAGSESYIRGLANRHLRNGEVIDKLQLTNRIPSNGHTLVSNLPGPKEQLYLMGARVEQYYPLSILVPGLRMNITLFSVGGILNYGIVATKDLPELNLLAEYISEEFDRLQKSVLGSQEVLAVN